MINKSAWMTVCCLVLIGGAWAQDSTSGEQTPLGDVVRQQREQRLHSKTAKHVVSDEDIPASRMHSMNGCVAPSVIIPCIKVSGVVPDDTSSLATEFGQKKDKIYVGFGPGYPDIYSCGSIDCEDAFLHLFERAGWIASGARIRFDQDDTIQNYPARVAHFEALHNIRGKMQGTVALIAAPVATVVAYCMYSVQDRLEAEPECDTFISSLQVEVPKRYIYVHH
jgi:hypothetical protein